MRFLRPDEPARRAVSVFQAAGVRALPVTDNGRMIGMVSEQDIVSYLAEHADAASAIVGDVMNREPVCGNIYMSVRQVADMMASARLEVLPVVDEFGGFRGVVTRDDVLTNMLDIVRMPPVAGLATPIGVRLTTGGVTAGAGSLGLFLSGVAMILIGVIAVLVVQGIALGADRLLGTTLTLSLRSPSTGTRNGMFGIDLVNTLVAPLQYLLFLFLLRMSPIASFHAAEHQVVHAIEAGEPLTPEAVARMPRAHPRCGTNLMVGVLLVVALLDRVPTGVAVSVGLLIVLTGWWKSIGYYLQQYFTTKPAGSRYIQNGIAVGEELIAKYKRSQGLAPVPVNSLTKLWNMGLPQVAMGAVAALSLVSWLVNKYGILLW